MFHFLNPVLQVLLDAGPYINVSLNVPYGLAIVYSVVLIVYAIKSIM